jgi:hypothetical protein
MYIKGVNTVSELGKNEIKDMQKSVLGQVG